MSSDLYVSEHAAALRVRDARRRRASRRRRRRRVAVAPDGTKPTEFVDDHAARGRSARERAACTSRTLVFDKEGVWDGVADREGEKLPFVFQVKAHADAPTVGAAAPHRRVADTDEHARRGPDLHARSRCARCTPRRSTRSIGKGKPVAVLFATPARCQSQYCGPGARQPAAARRRPTRTASTSCTSTSTRTSAPNETSPTVTAWNLPSEPWLFGIDASGAITDASRRRVRSGRDEAVLEHLAQ